MLKKRSIGKVGELEADIDRHLADLTRKQRQTLLLELWGAAMPLPDMYRPRHSEKERQRVIAKVRTNATRLLKAIGELDEEALEHVARSVHGINAADRGSTLYWATQMMRDMKPLLNGLAALENVPPYPYRVRRELLLAQDVVAALERAGIHVTAADTGAAAECFRAVAEIAGIPTSESPRYWIARAKAAEI
jgi:hypothetical protein